MASTAINFARGHPDPALLPHALIAKGANRLANIVRPEVSNPVGSAILNYSPGLGRPTYRQLLAKFITRQSDDGCVSRPENLLTVNGVSHGLSLIATVLTKPGDEVLMEVPCYYLACDIFKHHHLNVIPLHTQQTTPNATTAIPTQGFSVDTVEEMLRTHPKARLLYLVPTNCNPTGNTISSSERSRLVDICRSRNVIIVADEVYHFLDWKEDKARPARMVSFDSSFNHGLDSCSDVKKSKSEQCPLEAVSSTVISVSSFTKICSPGLRLGWIETSPLLINQLVKHGYIRSGGGVAPLAESLLETLLDSNDEEDEAERSDKVETKRKHTNANTSAHSKTSPVERHLQTMISSYKNKANVLFQSLTSNDFHVSFEPSGGYFIWVLIPESCPLDCEELVGYCEQNFDVSFLPGTRCQPTIDSDEKSDKSTTDAACPMSRWMRLCFAMMTEEDIVIGVKRLKEACDATKNIRS